MMKLTIKEIKKIIQEEMKDLRFPLGTGISDEGTNDWIKHIMKIIDKQEKPIQFSVRDLLKGWQEGLTFCGENAHIDLIIPPQLGYGDNELDDIPPHSILRYSIKVSKIK